MEYNVLPFQMEIKIEMMRLRGVLINLYATTSRPIWIYVVACLSLSRRTYFGPHYSAEKISRYRDRLYLLSLNTLLMSHSVSMNGSPISIKHK